MHEYLSPIKTIYWSLINKYISVISRFLLLNIEPKRAGEYRIQISYLLTEQWNCLEDWMAKSWTCTLCSLVLDLKRHLDTMQLAIFRTACILHTIHLVSNSPTLSHSTPTHEIKNYSYPLNRISPYPCIHLSHRRVHGKRSSMWDFLIGFSFQEWLPLVVHKRKAGIHGVAILWVRLCLR